MNLRQISKTQLVKSLFLALATNVSSGCDPSSFNSSPTEPKQIVRTETAPIEKRLPKLGVLQSASWTATKTSKDSFLSSPEINPTYRLIGFAQLKKPEADELSRKFDWQPVSASWQPALSITNFDLSNAEWSESKDRILPQNITGRLFFERVKGVVHFDLISE